MSSNSGTRDGVLRGSALVVGGAFAPEIGAMGRLLGMALGPEQLPAGMESSRQQGTSPLMGQALVSGMQMGALSACDGSRANGGYALTCIL